jgi:hypothetical protein
MKLYNEDVESKTTDETIETTGDETTGNETIETISFKTTGNETAEKRDTCKTGIDR